MSPSPSLFVYVTHPNREQALSLAQNCLEKKLIGCANLLSPVTSLYRWEGEICRDEEWVLILKTTEQRFSQLEEFIREHHPAQCPCIMGIPIACGSLPFERWLQSSVVEER